MRYLLLCLVLFGAACAQTRPGPALPPSSTVAVAGFICPRNDWELMAGVLPEETPRVDDVALTALNARMVQLMTARGGPFVSEGAVGACEETVIATKERHRQETVQYWRQVGTCLGVDYVLVPYVTQWRSRDGGEYGVNVPASVTLDLYLIDVATGQVRRAHFEEEQQGLAENLLSGKRFVKRKGRWLTPEELAVEGIAEAMKELGL
ncbi:MAG: hypothetical protein EOL86_05800 [Deltaproteobacteria bacterium]|nr:hypothetical protein [Deltaproteobacteria bacterium]